MVTVEAFAEYVGEDYASSDRQADLVASLSVASALMDAEVLTLFRPMPVSVFDQCVKDVALAVYQRASNNNGQYETESPNGPLDPLTRVKFILDRYRVMSV